MKTTKRIVIPVIVLIITSLCFLSPTSVTAQLRCEIQSSKTEVLPFEPLELVLSILNTNTSESIVAQQEWNASALSVGKPKESGEGWEWSRAYRNHAPLALPGPPMPAKAQTFLPNETKYRHVVSVLSTISYFGKENRPLFEKAGRVAVRGQIGGIQSEVIVITVKKPDGLNAEATKALEGTQLPMFFSEYSFDAVQVTKGELQRLEQFADKYKGSEYADYAALGLGLMHMKGVRDEQDPKREGKQDLPAAERYFTALAQKQGSVVKDRATYYVAVCRAKQGEKQSAAEVFQELAAQTKDPVLRFKVAEAIRE